MNWHKQIEVNADILAGKPVVKGTRIAVELILDRMSDGWTTDDLFRAYPQLKPEDLQAVFAFAAELLKEEEFIAIRKAAS